MGIAFFNNWKADGEFILLEISQNNKRDQFVFTVAVLGIGIVLIFNKLSI